MKATLEILWAYPRSTLALALFVFALSLANTHFFAGYHLAVSFSAAVSSVLMLLSLKMAAIFVVRTRGAPSDGFQGSIATLVCLVLILLILALQFASPVLEDRPAGSRF